MRFAIVITWTALMMVLCAIPGHAEKRVGLVVGNSTYHSIARLDNPARDAQLMADTLRDLGFSLVGDRAQLDLDKAGMDRTVQAFGRALQGADVGLFYYAGHGVQVRGANYLVPVDANPTREADVDFQMLDSNLVLRQMEGGGTRLNLVILDACRNNPFAGRGLRDTGGGLAQMRAPEGTLISFATQPGNVAQDGDDGHSPYTKALAASVRRPGLGLFDTFNEVGLAVRQITGGAQQPWVSSSPIAGSFYFAAPPTLAPTADEIAWNSLVGTTDVAALRRFVAGYPGSVHRDEAMARIRMLEFQAAEERRAADEERKKLAAVAPPVVPAMPSHPMPPVATAPVVPPSVSGPCASGAMTVAWSSRSAGPLSATEECALKPQDVFRECDKCPEMVVVPAGSFTMGSPESEKDRSKDEGPQHRVTFARHFAVGRFAVTFDEWDACVADGGCNGYRPSDQGWGRGRHPVINASWNNANAYAVWLSRKTGKKYRLLSEAEREYVTRAGTTTPFWWGASISTQQANYNGTLTFGSTVQVDLFQPNPWGLYQVHGNVWEWMEDCYHDGYTGAPLDGSAWTSGDCGRRVLRGGSWGSGPRALRAAARVGDTVGDTGGRHYDVYGFRLARTLTP